MTGVAMPGVTRRRLLRLTAGATVAVGATALVGTPATAGAPSPSAVPTSIRTRLGLDPRWYAKYLDAWGVPILGSARVTDAALVRARSRLGALLWTYPSWPVPELGRRSVRVVVVARDERMSSIPEVTARFGTALDDRYWGGFGATDALPITAGTEANLLDGDGVFVHEFAHTLHLMALRYIDPAFTGELDRAWAAARTAGRWRNTYAASTIQEYFAEGVQTYFGVNRVGPPGGDGVHNAIATRAALRRYDPPLHRLLNRVYHDATMT